MIRGTNKIPVKEQVLNTIKKYNLINENDIVLIGVSGGPDSICLLHILNTLKEKLKIKIYVAHVNHMIRKEADSETEYVRNICNNLGIECFVKKIDVEELAKQSKKGTEEMGREIRYNFFDEIANKVKANKIVTAHNNNDNAETILLNILRGSGISGLKGIEAKRDNKYIRPLIETNRKDIEEYCKDNLLNPKIDKTNLDIIYKRNKVRNELIPYIKKEFNPNIIKTINRLSEIVKDENCFLDKIVDTTFNDICIEEQANKKIILDLKKFNKLDIVIKRRIVLYTINKLLSTTEGIEKINIDDIIKLCDNNIGNKYLKPIKKLKILVEKGKIFYIALK